MIAATSAASRPPSAMRLDTSRSVMNRRPGETAAGESATRSSPCACVSGGGEFGSSVESALALSSAVGMRTLQPTCRHSCAARWMVSSTQALLASSTTFRLSAVRSAVPGARHEGTLMIRDDKKDVVES